MKKVTKIAQNTADLTEQTKLRVAAYCRVSTDSDEQLESLDAQIKHYESYVNANPEWEFAGLYYDEGISGTKKEKRPELLRMIADCEDRKIDLIVTKSISRFARNTTDCLELVRKLLNLDVFIFLRKKILTPGQWKANSCCQSCLDWPKANRSPSPRTTNGRLSADSKMVHIKYLIRLTATTMWMEKWLSISLKLKLSASSLPRFCPARVPTKLLMS